MILTRLMDRMKAYFIPHKSFDAKNKHIVKKWLGHTKVYDITDCLLSDTYETPRTKIVKTYYPGTGEDEARSRLLQESHYSKTSPDFSEKWYLLGHHKFAFVKGKTNAPNLSQKPVFVYEEGDYLFPYQILRNLKQSIFDEISGAKSVFRVNLNTLATRLNETLMDFPDNFPLRQQYMDKTIADTHHPVHKEQVAQQPNLTAQLPTPSPLTSQEKAVPEAPKTVSNTPKELLVKIPHKVFEVPSPEQLKQNKWEDQLLQRMEKHDWLIQQRAKIEASVRMAPERKKERLLSLNRRIKQNEKAQAILNRKLSLLQAIRNRDEWKQIQQEERKDYKDMSAQQKAQKIKLKTVQNADSKTTIDSEKLELKQIKQLKQESYEGYRFATRVTKMAGRSVQKLRDTKRQNTIFELSYIVHDKMALEKAQKTETDPIKKAALQQQIAALRQEKRNLIAGFKAVHNQKQMRSTKQAAPSLLTSVVLAQTSREA